MNRHTRFKLGISGIRKKPRYLIVAAAIQTVAVGSAQAYDPTTDLGNVAGLTELQQRAGDAVQRVCGGFIGAGGVDQTAADAAQQSVLFDKCGEMVHTARVLAGEDAGVAGRTNKDLNISTEDLGAALQHVSPEEIAAAGSLATETASQQTSAVGRRLASILSRVSSLQVSAANLNGSSSLVLLDQNREFSAIGGGGAASSDDLSSPFGFYANALGAFAEKSATDAEDAFESTSAGFSLGVDYMFSANTLAGINLGFVSSTTDFDTTQDVTGGDLESDQTNIAAYGMWFNDVGYVDVVAGFGTGSYNLERRLVVASNAAEDATTGVVENDGVEQTSLFGDTDSSSARFSIGGGMEVRSGALSFAPFTRLSYLSVDIDGYQETGESALKLRVEDQTIESLTGGFGFRLVGTYSGKKAIFSPQFSVELIHEFMDDGRQIVSSYVHDPRATPFVVVTDDPDRTYYSMGFGLSAVLSSGTQLFAEVRSLLDLDDLNEFSASAGVRFAL